MTPKEFAEAWKKERDYFHSEEYLAKKVASLQLPSEKAAEITSLFGTVLTDVFFSLLCGLDGSASIGDIQTAYEIKDEHGNVLCNGDGVLETEAWELFHGP